MRFEAIMELWKNIDIVEIRTISGLAAEKVSQFITLS